MAGKEYERYEWIDSMIISESYRLNMSVTISTSVSAAAIFCSEESLGAPPKRKDMMTMCSESGVFELGSTD